MTRILLRAHKNPFHAASADETLRRNLIGTNAGNLVFSGSTYRLLDTHDTEIVTSSLQGVEPGWVNENFDSVVIPLANAFRHSFTRELNMLSTLIEQLTIPVVILGVGSQADFDNEYPRGEAFDNSVRRFVCAVLKRSPSIGVRGELTNAFLTELGFGSEEVEVIGCPSMFWDGPVLKVMRKVDELDDQSKIALNISPYQEAMGPLSLEVTARHPNLIYMAQDHKTLNLIVNGYYDGKQRPSNTEMPVTLDHPLIAGNRVRFCLDPTTWMNELNGYDFSIGTRIHGNITAIVAGTPAVVIAHDGRTRELAEYHHIPYVRLEAVANGIDIAELYAESDWGPMMEHQAGLWQHFESFLTSHGLRTTFSPGEGRGRFDKQMASLELPEPVQTLMGRPHETYALKREVDRMRREAIVAQRELDRMHHPIRRRVDAVRRRLAKN